MQLAKEHRNKARTKSVDAMAMDAEYERERERTGSHFDTPGREKKRKRAQKSSALSATKSYRGNAIFPAGKVAQPTECVDPFSPG